MKQLDGIQYDDDNNKKDIVKWTRTTIIIFNTIVICILILLNFLPMMLGYEYSYNTDDDDIASDSLVNDLERSTPLKIALVISITASVPLIWEFCHEILSWFKVKEVSNDSSSSSSYLQSSYKFIVLLVIPDLYMLIANYPVSHANFVHVYDNH